MSNTQAKDIKQLQEDLRRLKEDVEYKANTLKEETLKNIEKRWQESLVFALILLTLIVACLALSINNMSRLNEYDRQLKEVDEFSKHIQGLNEIKRDVPGLKATLTDVGEQTSVIKQFMPSAKLNIEYLKKEFEKMNSTDKKVKDIESSLSSINNDYIELKKLSDNQKEQWEQFNISIETVESNVFSLRQNANDANSKVLPVIQKQKELLININDSNEKMLEINDTVNNMTLRLSEVTKNVTDLQPQLEIVGNAAANMTDMKEDVHKLETEIRTVSSSMSKLNSETKKTEFTVSEMSKKVEQLSNNVSEYMKELSTLNTNQSELDNKIDRSQEGTEKLENDVSYAKVQVDALKNEVTESEKNVKIIKLDIAVAASKIQKEMWFYNVSIDTLNDTTSNLTKEMSSNAAYIENTVPPLVSSVKTLQSSAAFPWMSVVSVFDVLLIAVVIVVFSINPHWHVGHSQNDMPPNPNGYGHERRQGLVHQRPQSILDSIHRVPILQNKVCVLSFYSETMKLHRKLVESALATSRRGNSMEVMQYLVRKHEDILGIPSARYIFVFVDFNERNVILENPGQDLGDKKLVTVQAAQKIGADVFVTYVRDKGSHQLLPGNLFNQELSAFTSHHVLKRLENNQRCFSVYETFNNTQKESIVHSVL